MKRMIFLLLAAACLNVTTSASPLTTPSTAVVTLAPKFIDLPGLMSAEYLEGRDDYKSVTGTVQFQGDPTLVELQGMNADGSPVSIVEWRLVPLKDQFHYLSAVVSNLHADSFGLGFAYMDLTVSNPATGTKKWIGSFVLTSVNPNTAPERGGNRAINGGPYRPYSAFAVKNNYQFSFGFRATPEHQDGAGGGEYEMTSTSADFKATQTALQSYSANPSSPYAVLEIQFNIKATSPGLKLVRIRNKKTGTTSFMTLWFVN